MSVPLIEKLAAEPAAIATARSISGAPASPGFYAWWLIDVRALPDVPVTPHPSNAELGLSYLGIAPNTATSQATIRSRMVGDHLGRALGSSTLRRALAALLWQEQGWRPFTKGKKPAFSDEDSDALTRWMERHFEVSWCGVNEPWRYESQLIGEMQPPLNSDHNHSHPFYPTLKRLREDLMAVARSNGSAS